MKIVAVIPARYKSSRFPGKPLARLLGKPMILYVCETTASAVGPENTYVATDSTEIAEVVAAAGFQIKMTSSDCLTGTDRVAEAVADISADIVVNVQGDEPMLDPKSIRDVIALKTRDPNVIVNGMARVGPEEDPWSPNMPKVVVSEARHLLYMSRALLPASKQLDVRPAIIWKQVCIYAFTRSQLRAFRAFGRKSFNESYEDIEILRFLDIGIPVQMIELPQASLAVDTPQDVALVEQAMQKRNGSAHR